MRYGVWGGGCCSGLPLGTTSNLDVALAAQVRHQTDVQIAVITLLDALGGHQHLEPEVELLTVRRMA